MRCRDWILNNIFVYAFAMMTGLFSITCGNSDTGGKNLCPAYPPKEGEPCSTHGLEVYKCSWGGAVMCCGKSFATSQVECECVQGYKGWDCVDWRTYCACLDGGYKVNTLPADSKYH